ncbi:MAG: thioredoxin family protein [Bacteroidales bacterium]|jgi:thioredoxin-related protein|nr:thioredoxin family protein [Bacteroidales bacterium]HOI32485.1 thioredoxin family protein [Bacteroidales bacterium]
MTKTIIAAVLLFLVSYSAVTQETKIDWLDFETAVEKMKTKPKKIFIDMYTDWCGWCKKMDKETFANPVIAAYMQENFYMVKFDAERSDTVVFANRTFVNPNPGKSRSSHELAQALLQGKMSYPSYVFMNEEMRIISVVPGFFPAQNFEPVIHFFGSNAYKDQDWETYGKSFKGKLTGK